MLLKKFPIKLINICIIYINYETYYLNIYRNCYLLTDLGFICLIENVEKLDSL